jgi:hypothetical protein
LGVAAPNGAVSVPNLDWTAIFKIFRMMILAVTEEFGFAVPDVILDRIGKIFEQKAKTPWKWLKLIPVVGSVSEEQLRQAKRVLLLKILVGSGQRHFIHALSITPKSPTKRCWKGWVKCLTLRKSKKKESTDMTRFRSFVMRIPCLTSILTL